VTNSITGSKYIQQRSLYFFKLQRKISGDIPLTVLKAQQDPQRPCTHRTHHTQRMNPYVIHFMYKRIIQL